MIAMLRKKFRQSRRFWLVKSKDTSLDLGIESLEMRKMLAGDVSVNVSGDNLVIMGDGDANSIEIYEAGGTIWVYGSDTTLTGDAEESGDDFDTGIAADELNKLTVKLKGGNDELYLDSDGIEINGTAKIITGGGNDYVELYDGFGGYGVSYGKFIIKTGGGNDEVEIDDWDFVGPVTLKTGGGNDYVYVGYYGEVGVYSKAKVSLGGGEDYLFVDTDSLSYGSGSGPVVLNGGGGEDTFNGNGFSKGEIEDFSDGLVRIKSFEIDLVIE